MPLAVGSRIGPYQISELLGAGGMGEVYRARDTRLGRDVALKILPELFASDPDRLARFEREAQLLGSLNHPNIAIVHGLEEDHGQRALVMELVDGPTLADRIARGAMPVDEALTLAHQIADALAAAHDHGIVHRDLKPSNVKLRSDGTVKVLDFGLARLAGSDTTSDGVMQISLSPTITTPAMTRMGVILGTAAYMSPEQAKGLAVDKRSDIWAFGVVLHEMLTGRQLFGGETMTDVLAAVVRAEPSWEAIPNNVRRLLKRCLERDPKKRLRDLGDAWSLLDEPPVRVDRPGPAAWIVAATFGIIALIALVGWWRATRPATTKQPLMHLDVDLGRDSVPLFFSGADVIISPDGTRVVYVLRGRLFMRRLDQSAGAPLPDTDGAFGPFFSPDGEWIGFFTQGKLKKISVDGGAAVVLCDAISGRGGSWGDDGTIVASLGTLQGLWRIPESGGTPVLLTELASGEFSHRWPQVLPGGKAVLFTSNGAAAGYDRANIEVVSLSDRRRKTVHMGGTFGRYLPSGHLVYINRGTLFALPFDLDRLEASGTPVPVQDHIAYSTTNGFARLDISGTGTLVYTSGGDGAATAVRWLDARGQTMSFVTKPVEYLYPALSPDGKRLAVTEGTTADIWVYDAQRNTSNQLTFGRLNPTNPMWTSDGRYVLFQSPGGMFWTRSDGGSKPQLLTASKNVQFPWSFSPDGKRLAYIEVTPETGYDLWTVPVARDDSGIKTTGMPEPFLNTTVDERYPSFSPDGRWLAYASNESGMFQINVRAFPDRGGRWLVGKGVYPVWARNGRELFFRAEDNRIMVVSYAAKDDTFIPDTPRVWSDRPLADFGIVGTRTFDLAPDGTRVVALLPEESSETEKPKGATFVFNFFDEVRRRTAAKP